VLSEAQLLGATTVLAVVWAAGLTVDIWYHLHRGFAIESFFTPAHALLYGAMTLTGLPALLYAWDSARLQARRIDWLPPGFVLVLIGWSLYGLGGGFDFAWHALVGFEVTYDAVLSPSHTWLALSYAIVVFGLIKAAASWRVRQSSLAANLRWSDVPLLIAFGLLLRTCVWYLTYVSPLTADFATGGAAVRDLDGYAGIAWTNLAGHMAGAVGIFLDSVLVALIVVGAVRHFGVPRGGITIMLMLNAVLVVTATEQWLALPAVLAGALTGEVVRARIRSRSATGYWVLGASVPLVQTAAHLALLGLFGGGLVWAPHLWVGVPVIAGVYGLVVAMFVVPPAFASAGASQVDYLRPRDRAA
jgi:hypothetical protein